MRLAYFSPLNPAPSGVSDYSRELLAELGAYADITVVVDGYSPTDPEIRARFAVMQDRDYDASQFELALYHLGNSPPHAYIYRRAMREPGVIVLHDWALHHLVAWTTLEQGDRAGYVEAMRETYGARGAELAEREALGLEGLDRFAFPLSERLAQGARGVIAHSRYVCERVERVAPRVAVAQIPHEMPMKPPMEQRTARARLGLPTEPLLVGTFGNVGPTKRTAVLLDAFRRAFAGIPPADIPRTGFPNAQLVCVGAVADEFDLNGLIELFGLRGAVQVIGHTSLAVFEMYMAAMDVCVNLRYPTAGETSGAVLRMMAQGKPVIVSRAGWFEELPDAVVAKVEPDETETALLGATLKRLLGDAGLRAALGRNARSYVEQVCAVGDAARAYADFLEGVRANRAVSRSYEKAWNAPVSPSTGQSAVSPEKVDDANAMSELPTDDWKQGVADACAALGLDDEELRRVASAMVGLGLGP